MTLSNLKKRIITSIFLLFLLVLIFNYDFYLVYTLIVLGVISIIEFSTLIKKIFNKKKFFILLNNIIFILYIFIFFSLFFLFSNLYHFKIILFLLIASCVASDIGGFFFGKIFKGPKLTRISPKKTFAGAMGSLILTILVVGSFFYYLTNHYELKTLIIALMISISCQLGDLFFSFLKRKANTKDTGNIFPGHGGVLDRIDGMLIGIPFGFFLILLIY